MTLFPDIQRPVLMGSKYHLDKIIRETCKKHNTTVWEILGTSRKKSLVDCRQEIAKKAKEYFTTTEIGVALRRDHSTIVHLIKDRKAG